MNIVTKEEYWSIILNDSTQIGQITTEDTEFNRRINDVNLVLSNTFINSSDENLISNWETSLYIDGIEGKTITERKADILYTLCEKNYVPVSIIKRFLLNLIGDENRFDVEFIKDENKLVIRADGLDESQLEDVCEMLEKMLESVLPQNVFVELPYYLPAGYKRVEYLESTGVQYIDTLFAPDNTSGLHTKHLYLNEENSRPGGTIGLNKLYAISINYSSGLAYGFGNTYINVGNKELYSYIQNGYLNFSNRGVWGTYLTVADKTLSGFHIPDIHFSGTSTIFIFGLNNGYGSLTHNFTGRIYQVQISQGNVVVHSFVPCLDPTGAPCMYDTVSKQPFYNLGAGDFIYPTETTTYSLRRPLPDWGKLTKNGLRRLYHAPASYKGELIDYALENGFKPIIEPEIPEEGYWTPQWSETEEEIILGWVETEPPSTEDFNLEQPTEI